MGREADDRYQSRSDQLVNFTTRGPLARSFVGKVTQIVVPPASGNYVFVMPQAVGGTEAEGQAVTLAQQQGTPITVAVLQGVPSVGDYLICRAIPGSGRWVADRTGKTSSPPAPGVNLPNCFCLNTPAIINFTATNGGGSSYGGYAGSGCSGTAFGYQSCTLTYYAAGTAPYPYQSPLPGGGTTSLAGYFSPVLTDPTYGYQLYYRVDCQYDSFRLWVVTNMSGSWSPPGSIYIVWTIDNVYNFCHPFSMTKGNDNYGGGANATCPGLLTLTA